MSNLLKSGILYAHMINSGKRIKDKLIISNYLVKGFFNKILRKKSTGILSSDVYVKNKNGIYFCGNNISSVLSANPLIEANLDKFFDINEGVFIDVGSCIGKYTVPIGKKLFNRGKIISIEADKDNFNILKKNIELNNLENVDLLNVACSDKNGIAKFFLHSEGPGGHSLHGDKIASKKFVEVKTRTIDSIVNERVGKEKINLIKIDVEGAEVEVIKGALKTLEKHHPTIILEAWDEKDIKEIATLLSPLNYNIHKIDKENYLIYYGSNIKVAMVSPDIKYEKGIALYSSNIAEIMNNKGVKIDLITYEVRSYTSLLKTITRLKKYDVIHIQHEYNLFGRFAGIFFAPYLILIKLMNKGKIITTMHTVHGKEEQLVPNVLWWSWIKKQIIYPITNKLIGMISIKIITHADFLKNILINDYKIKRNKIKVIPQIVKHDAHVYQKIKSKKELGLSGNVYLMIGHMSKQKGIDTILKLAKEIGKTIVITGHPKIKNNVYSKDIEEFKKYIEEHNLQEYVTLDLTSINSKERKWDLYFSAADIILMPYKKMTTSGIFSDAMAYGKPVIGSTSLFFQGVQKKYKCLKIAKSDQDYPLLVKEVMKPKIMKNMETEAKRYAKNHSFDSLGERYKLLYESLI